MNRQKLKLFVPDRAPSHRQQRVAEEIRFCLSQIFLRGDWPPRFDEVGELIPPPASIVTITGVTVSADLKHATIWIVPFLSPLGDTQNNETQNFKAFFEAMRGYLRKQLASKIHLRGIPDLKFEIDLSSQRQAKIEAILKGN